MAGQSVCFLLHCLCGGPEPAQPIRHAALPLQAMDETSQHIKVSRNPMLKTPQGTYTYSVRLGALYKLTCSSYTPGLSSLHGSDTSGGPSPISQPRRPSSL